MITRDEVLHVAKLARIELTEDEIKVFQTQLSDILGYIDILDKAKFDEAKAVATVSQMHNSWRQDKIEGCDDEAKEAILEAAPQRDGDYIQVPSILN